MVTQPDPAKSIFGRILILLNIKPETMKTTEGNVLIAEFLGHKVVGDVPTTGIEKMLPIYNIETDHCKGYIPSGMRYDRDWDWLMKAVFKIKEICLLDDDLYDGDEFTLLRDHLICVTIEDTYRHVLAFIEMYNAKK
jgi:hypothetical protein